jgi:GxxExxY protein
MPRCSNCKEEGHTRARCQNPTVVAPPRVLEEVPLVDIQLPEDVRAKFGRIVQMCEEVAYGLGKGHVEAHYQQALCVELQMAGIQHVTEEVMPITYKGRPIGGGCNWRLDIVLLSFLPFIIELKAIPGKLGNTQDWQLVRYMTYKDVPYGAVVNFSQSDKGQLEFHFIVRHSGSHWLYEITSQKGIALSDFTMTSSLSEIDNSDNDE